MTDKEVVAMLPYSKGKVLLQLRDQKEGIVFPGHWGFFSGSLEDGESPEQAALRELWEELEYKPPQLIKLATRRIPELNKKAHLFYCSLAIPLRKLVQHEGMDAGLFSWKEISTLRLYSARKKEFFPVVGTPFVLQAIQDVLREAPAQGL